MIASPDWITEENALRTTNQDRAGATPCPSSGAAALRINGRRPTKPSPNTTLVAVPRACTWGGYQISYDSLPTQLIALGPATSTPNAIGTAVNAPNTGRRSPNWFEGLPTVAAAPALTDNRTAIDPDIRNPYTERWSFGFQRQLPQSTVLDVSYIGSQSHRLTTKAEWNPRLSTGVLRLYPAFGSADIRTSEGNSSYDALQARLDRPLRTGSNWRRLIHGRSSSTARAKAWVIWAFSNRTSRTALLFR